MCDGFFLNRRYVALAGKTSRILDAKIHGRGCPENK